MVPWVLCKPLLSFDRPPGLTITLRYVDHTSRQVIVAMEIPAYLSMIEQTIKVGINLTKSMSWLKNNAERILKKVMRSPKANQRKMPTKSNPVKRISMMTMTLKAFHSAAPSARVISINQL